MCLDEVRNMHLSCRDLKLETVAEGVETQEQLNSLINSECDIVQGFLFSKPVPAEQYAQLMRTGINWGSGGIAT